MGKEHLGFLIFAFVLIFLLGCGTSNGKSDFETSLPDKLPLYVIESPLYSPRFLGLIPVNGIEGVDSVFSNLVLSDIVQANEGVTSRISEEDSKALTIALQVILGTPAAYIGLLGGVFYLMGITDLVDDLGNVVVAIAVIPGIGFMVVGPGLASSATVYGIGKAMGYDGTFKATFLSGLLGSVANVLGLSFLIAYEGEGPGFYLFLGGLVLMPIVEAIGFHKSHEKQASISSGGAKADFIVPLVRMGF